MSVLSEYMHQQVPSYNGETPVYYRRALMASGIGLTVCFLLHAVLMALFRLPVFWPLMLACCAGGFCYALKKNFHPGLGLGVYAAVTILWCGGYIYAAGWGCGGQHLLMPLLILCFFNVFIPPWRKLLYMTLLILFRMGLYAWSLKHEPIFQMEGMQSILLQTVNSLTLFLVLAVDCVLLSSSIQSTERKLRIDNQELSREADTDPLTQLLNRRAMLHEMRVWTDANPGSSFCVAIADIDFFKKVNDTYGHDCGDEVLKKLTALFREKAGNSYQVCRWGGEEFCFFMPGMNLDEGGVAMNDLCIDVSRMQLDCAGHSFGLTITIGVEENDFLSPLDDLIKSADQKLYIGKNAGRNRVVV